MNRFATPISLIAGITGGVLAYSTSGDIFLGVIGWFAATGCAVFAFDVIESRRPECRAAVEIVLSLHPDWNIWTTSASLRAAEPRRSVVAVFFESRSRHVKPPQFVLVALDREFQFIELLPVSPESPYFIFGRK